MKRVLQATLILFVLAFTACSFGLQDDELPGTWHITGVATEAPQLSLALIADAESEALSSIYEFKADHRFTLTSGFLPEGKSGTWEYNAETPSLRLIFDDAGFMGEQFYTLLIEDDNKFTAFEDLGELGSLSMTMTRQ